jgi:hypothetical protein
LIQIIAILSRNLLNNHHHEPFNIQIFKSLIALHSRSVKENEHGHVQEIANHGHVQGIANRGT